MFGDVEWPLSVNVNKDLRPKAKVRTKNQRFAAKDRTKDLSSVQNIILVHGQVTIIFVVSVCLFVCLFVQSFSQPSLIRFRSNEETCYTSGSSCVP